MSDSTHLTNFTAADFAAHNGSGPETTVVPDASPPVVPDPTPDQASGSGGKAPDPVASGNQKPSAS